MNEPAPTTPCEGCGARRPPAELALDLQGRYICRPCHALASIEAARQVEGSLGFRRMCPRCKGPTMVAGEPWQPITLEGEGGGEADVTVGHPYRCGQCRRRVFLLAPGGFFALLVVAYVIGAVVYANGGGFAGVVFAIASTVVICLREVFERWRHPKPPAGG